MTKILVIEDDPGIRTGLKLMLKAQGYDVTAAENGRLGLEAARAETPDLIFCDVNMPEMDGMEVLRQLRREPALGATPFVFLTSLAERSQVRRGMNLGADDYLTKPFTRSELLEAVNARLAKQETTRKVLTNQLLAGSDTLRQRFRSQFSGEASPTATEELPPAGMESTVAEATVLFTDIRGFTTMSEQLAAVEIAELLNVYLGRACTLIVGCGGKVVKFIGDGMMAVFPHTDSRPREMQALQAVNAGLGLSLIAFGFRDWVQQRYPDRGLPEFAVGVGIHTGEITMCRLGIQGQEDFTAIGDTVNVASRLEGQTKELGWPVVASEATIRAAGRAVVHGASRSVTPRGRVHALQVYEVTGLSDPAVTSYGTGGVLPASLREALEANAESAASVAKEVLMELRSNPLRSESSPG